MADEQVTLEAKAGRDLPDLNLWYRLFVSQGTNPAAVVAGLNALPIVETAYVEPPPAPPPGSVFAPAADLVDFEALQGYLNQAPAGIDARFAWTKPGGDGSGVKIIDIENSWNQSHEDLSKAAGALIANGTPFDFFGSDNHGTAVLGEMIADRNNLGVTGITYGASVGMVNDVIVPGFYVLANAIDLAHANLAAGDVMLIEQQVPGPFDWVPVEWVHMYFDAIQRATAAGIVVVEAAGNGSTNLDDPVYGGAFNRSLRDSGAIIVGAGAALPCSGPSRSRLSFSNYGGRVDLQGWGVCVSTTGYGDLHGFDYNPAAIEDPGPNQGSCNDGIDNGNDGLKDSKDPDCSPGKNHWYTRYFSGTSSASPIVAGAAAALQGMKLAIDGVPLTPSQVRDMLVATGTSQDTSVDSGHIGPLPNLRAAFDALVSLPTPTPTPTPTSTPTPTPTPTPPPPVGGVSFDPEEAAAPLRTSDSSRVRVGLLPGIAAAVAVAIALGGAARHAGRRPR